MDAKTSQTFDLFTPTGLSPENGLSMPAEEGACSVLPSRAVDESWSFIMSNWLLRSALFSTKKGGGQQLLKRQKVAATQGVEILYTGGVLSQSDLDMFYTLLYLNEIQYKSGIAEFGIKPLLKILDRSNGKTDREWAKNSIAKLSATTIEITAPDGVHVYGGSLIDDFIHNKETGRYVVRLNKNLASMFAGNMWTAINLQQRMELRRRPLAQWLHSFYSTHKTPWEYGVVKIMELSGSETKEVFNFRARLHRALEHLSDATGWACHINQDKDTVVVNKERQIAPDTQSASEAFKRFWEAYHPRRRINFTQAWTVWQDGDLDAKIEDVMAGLDKWIKSQDWFNNDGRWIPTPDKWLDQKRWQDHPAPYKAALGKDGSGRATHDHGEVPRDYGKLGAF